ncbi:MAG: ComF family protein [Candidatus Hydrogenedentes bacterium]|nr:ComF family protein [Candidatus Hydrogenedentota bacterium]
MSTWQEWWLDIKNLFLPIFCRQCGVRLMTEENGYFCPTCWEASPRVERPFCTGCGKPHEAAVGIATRSNFPCAECRNKPNRYVRRIFGAGVYDGPVAEAVKLLKFGERLKLAGPLSELMTEFAARELDVDQYTALVPVPLHKVRQRERGFNQSLLLAAGALPAFPHAELDTSLLRIRPTRTQSRLKAEERAANVRGAFAVVGDSLKGKTVLLIDDVVTTGGTITECARAMRRAGAVEVDVFAAALAVH